VEKIKKILITGGQGMLGMALSKTASSLYAVTVIDKEECDITDAGAVKNFFSGNAFDAIIHCAAYTNVDRAEDEPDQALCVNARGTENIVAATHMNDCLFVYISTDYIFDGTKAAPYTEEDTPHPISIYGTTKLKGEHFAQKHPRGMIVRTSWLFGPGGNNFVRTILSLSRQKDTLEVVNDQVGSPTYTVHLAQALLEVLNIYFNKGLPYGTYHVTNSGVCSWYEFARQIVENAKLGTAVTPITSAKLTRKAKRPRNSVLSNEKFHALTGHYLPTWRNAVAEYMEIK
jgi:dTDP-4-dehydrorhamnose reductase